MDWPWAEEGGVATKRNRSRGIKSRHRMPPHPIILTAGRFDNGHRFKQFRVVVEWPLGISFVDVRQNQDRQRRTLPPCHKGIHQSAPLVSKKPRGQFHTAFQAFSQ